MALFSINDAEDMLQEATLQSMGAYINLSALRPAELLSKIRAAEAEAAHRLRVYFEPTVIVPDDAPQEEIDALEEAGTKYATEASHDYSLDLFSDGFAYIVAKQKPVISVQSIKFSYPSAGNNVWELPKEWIRVDRKYGHVRILPAMMSFSAPLAGMVMQALSGGRTIPFMIQMRYTAGLKDAAGQYPELIDVIKKMAILKLLQASFLPSSGSISADGLSQSQSVDVKSWGDGIEDQLSELRDAIHGIRSIVL